MIFKLILYNKYNLIIFLNYLEIQSLIHELKNDCVPSKDIKFELGLVGIHSRYSSVASALQMLSQVTILRDYLIHLPNDSFLDKSFTNYLKDFFLDSWREKYSSINTLEIDNFMNCYYNQNLDFDFNDPGEIAEAMLKILHEESIIMQNIKSYIMLNKEEELSSNKEIETFYSKNFGFSFEWELTCSNCKQSKFISNLNFSIQTLAMEFIHHNLLVFSENPYLITRLSLLFPIESNIHDIKFAVSKKMEIDINSLVVGEVKRNRIKLLDDSQTFISLQGALFIYEIPQLANSSENGKLFTFTLRYLEDNFEKNSIPFVRYINNSSSNSTELYLNAFHFMNRFKYDLENENQIIKRDGLNYPFELYDEIYNNNNFIDPVDSYTIKDNRNGVLPSIEIYFPYPEIFDYMYIHPRNLELQEFRNYQKDISSIVPTIEDCIYHTLQDSQLISKCNNCNLRNTIYSQVRIKKLPRIMLIKLKRKNKISHIPIKFPLYRFDISKIDYQLSMKLDTEIDKDYSLRYDLLSLGVVNRKWNHSIACSKFRKNNSIKENNKAFWYYFDELQIEVIPNREIESDFFYSNSTSFIYEKIIEKETRIIENEMEDQFRVKLYSKSKFLDYVYINSNSSISFLKEKIGNKFEIDPNHFYIGFDEAKLDKDMNVLECGIENEDPIYLNEIPPPIVINLLLKKRFNSYNGPYRIKMKRTSNITNLRDVFFRELPKLYNIKDLKFFYNDHLLEPGESFKELGMKDGDSIYWM